MIARALAILAVAAAPLAAQEIGIEVGAKAPDAQVVTLEGQAASLAKSFAGKPAVIYFWATWCGNCKELEPTMTAAYNAHHTQVAFAGVAVGVNQSPDRVKRYTAEHYVGFTHFFDSKGNGVEAYDVPATSYVVVINKAGVVVYTGQGGKQDLETAIQKALK